jgi:hypothetical protein
MNAETTLHLRRMIGFDDPRDTAVELIEKKAIPAVTISY